MGDFKTRLNNARTKLLRRPSATSTTTTSTAARSIASSAGSDRPRKGPASSLRKSVSLTKLAEVSTTSVPEEDEDQRLSQSAVLPQTTSRPFGRPANPTEESLTSRDRRSQDNTPSTATQSPTQIRTACPAVTLEEPTPIPLPVHPAGLTGEPIERAAEPVSDSEDPSELPPSSSTRSLSKPTPPAVIRRQSLVTTSNARIIKTLLEPEAAGAGIASGPPTSDYFSGGTAAAPFNAGMLHRKIWVKRPNASATLVQIREDDLVDDVRDMILKKYTNSLGRNFDAPDVTLRISPRHDTNNSSATKGGERQLGPEEEMCRTLDAYYPGGQTVNEALLIDVPQRRTPKPSPRVPMYYAHHDDTRPYENSSEYFPPMPIVNPSPAAISTASHAHSHDPRPVLPHPPHSIAVLSTGQLPPLPSPGSSRKHHGRPKYPRHNTASPTTIMNATVPMPPNIRPPQRQRHDSSASDAKHTASSNAPIPTPPAPTENALVRQGSTPPTPRVSSPRPDKPKRKKPKPVDAPSLPAGLLDGSVPPINVLIVEDNIINLRVLGAFMQRLKVRWQRAMNGKEAVTKWRAGGFHLVLMDIQLPIMNGLDATKEIRRLERVNSIGVFSSGSNEAPHNRLGDDGSHELKDEDRLGDRSLFKSPVIIVALTASSLQSDRHEALAAGCNDFLTKPVNFVWLERKVKEWGCMQALIDFDGWRKWKDFAAQTDTTDGTSKLSTSYSSIAPKARGQNVLSPTTTNANAKAGTSTANGSVTKTKDEEKKNKRRSLGVVPPPALPEEDSLSPEQQDDSQG
ncbi:hypothetical protein BDV96DRAFT_600865 [Lophiotrema nucula]|uniref:Response regulatory domain-containing protein n=1 Tax=Lophiotrema nucula TaxID=690887 RepID=A0A6A5Z408_9PLEO|nr:hypothetical protein BDV96DRAFT_600865 [Lophiotrema nucula]